jgi:hypothetical protein
MILVVRLGDMYSMIEDRLAIVVSKARLLAFGQESRR